MRRLYEQDPSGAIVSQSEIDQMYANGRLELDDESPLRGDVVFGHLVDDNGHKHYVFYHFIRCEACAAWLV